jgi:hypothetical protein
MLLMAVAISMNAIDYFTSEFMNVPAIFFLRCLLQGTEKGYHRNGNPGEIPGWNCSRITSILREFGGICCAG